MSPSRFLVNSYAGAKFSDPPSPQFLPKPPSSWMQFNNDKENEPVVSTTPCVQMTNVLKVMLNVQA